MNYRVLALQRGPDLVGYLVYRRSEEANEERHIHIADWWLGPAAYEHTMSALTGALLADVHSFWPSFIAASALGEPHHEQLRKAGFIARAGEHNATGFHCERPELLPVVQSAERWRLTDLGDDSDGVS